jgi:hypothetical protein
MITIAKPRPKRKARGNNDIKNIIVVSDQHCGCRVGLCHPDGVALDDGGWYKPSAFQLKLWSIWDEFWDVWVPKVTHGESYVVVANGDMVDGVHHGSTTQISQNLEDQCEIAHRIFKPIVERCEGRFYMVRGTEAHVGKSAKEEERLAKSLHAIPNKQRQYSRWELNKYCGPFVCNFMHHIGTTSSSAHETSAVNAELHAAFVEAGRWGRVPPAVTARAHRHRNCEVRIPTHWGYGISFVTAAWQGKTPFAFKVAGGRMTTPQFGGSAIRLGDEELHTRHFVRDIERDPAE